MPLVYGQQAPSPIDQGYQPGTTWTDTPGSSSVVNNQTPPDVMNWWGSFVAQHGGAVGRPTPVQRTTKDMAGTTVPYPKDSYEGKNPYYHYEFADGTAINVDNGGQIEPGSLKYGEKPINTHPDKGSERWVVHPDGQGNSVLVREVVNDNAGTWTVDRDTPPQPFINGNTSSQSKYVTVGDRIVELKPDGSSQVVYLNKDAEDRANRTADLASQREDRLTAAQERMADAEKARVELETKKAELDDKYRQGTLSLEEAKLEWDKEHAKVVDLQNSADLALKQSQEAATENYRTQDLSQRREDARARTSSENYRSDVLQRDIDTRYAESAAARDVQAQANIYGTLGQIGAETARTAVSSLPFMAPTGTSGDLASIENAMMSGGGLGSLPKITPRSMPFPFNPATIATDAMQTALKNMPPQILNTITRKPGTDFTGTDYVMPPRVQTPNINSLFPPGAVTLSGQYPGAGGEVAPGPGPPQGEQPAPMGTPPFVAPMTRQVVPEGRYVK